MRLPSSLARPARTAALVLAALTAAPALTGCFAVVAAGMGGAAMSATDRRSTGSQVDDQAIELAAANRLRKRYGDNVSVSVVSYNRRALVYGQVGNDAAKDEVVRIVRGIDNVRDVIDETEITTSTPSLGTTASDTLITQKVKLSFVDAKDVFANSIKVVTERGTVYLMGIVTAREADRAAQVAAGVSSVMRVVKAFEIVSESDLANLNATRPADPVPGPTPRN
ncbi:BON domain-containing protein [Derxia gummosa]|uniref:BON domain-containing protein n=1 Tax=Derxia gummosa DSM 723 TaxID=1121388 RepID=A0A8B6X2X1_9BURK|nr:BON domain-containing protein [Derxia gummosa]